MQATFCCPITAFSSGDQLCDGAKGAERLRTTSGPYHGGGLIVLVESLIDVLAEVGFAAQ
jgi:hypothetical protein